jgi:hypothetical protein
VSAKEQLILAVWDEMGRDSAGAAELELIQQALRERLQLRESPASIARTLADHGVSLNHPEILDADSRWREHEVFSFFTAEELNFPTIEAAVAWVETVSALPEQDELRGPVLLLKMELGSVASSGEVPFAQREIAAEVAHWLTVWLQNPSIFADLLALRRQSPEFCERFVR